ncbi:MAG: hypothetical protein K2O34_00370 [Acetatifactor sp.]|nr:hypothetical protein [Acetatifactor sp.]
MKKNIEKNNLAIEKLLRQSADTMPKPEKDVPVLNRESAAAAIQEGEDRGLWGLRILGRAAIAFLSLAILGTGTAFAASAGFRQAVIRFFTSGVREEVPIDRLTGEAGPEGTPESEESAVMRETEKTEENVLPITMGAVTFMDRQILDEHFVASYLYSPEYLDVETTPSGNLLFYTQPEGARERTFYQLIDGRMETVTPVVCRKEGRISLGNLPGVMDTRGREDYSAIVLPEMTFEVEWQQYGDTILLADLSERFDIASTFGGMKNGSPLEDDYDGRFTTMALLGDTEWIVVSFLFDTQYTDYVYPFLFNLRTGEVQDVLHSIDLSRYPCITELTILDRETATALAGENHDVQRKITIYLSTGEIVEESPSVPPAADYHFMMDTGENTIFYTIGTDEHVGGYLYDRGTQETLTLFEDAAWGYVWDYGFADAYVQIIDRHYAAYYKEPENEVYLMDLTDGTTMLLEGIPASHDVNFFQNPQSSLLCISVCTQGGNSLLAFYRPGMETARYFERELPEGVQESGAMWIGENKYLIRAVSQDREQYYLYLYEYVE